jgi:hypothetical protein
MGMMYLIDGLFIAFAESIDELPDKKRASLIDRIKQHEKK